MKRFGSLILVLILTLMSFSAFAEEYTVLEVGSRGDEVKALQQALIDLGFLTGTADGIYGNGTAGAVKSFQESVGLEPTGIADSETQRKLYGDDEIDGIVINLTGVTETNYMHIDGMFVDESYKKEGSDNMTILYLFYTVTTPDKNLSVDSTNISVNINGINTYSASHHNKVALYMGSYSYSGYLRDVYFGDEFKVMATFILPKAELAPGRTISISSTQIPGCSELSLVTDDIIFLSSAKNIAKVVDPEGYADMAYKLAYADADTEKKVKNAINGYYWTFYVNSTSYKIEFYSNKYELTTAFGTTDGTYTVRNGFVVVENAYTGAINYIPYSWGPNDIDLEVTDGFDVNEKYY